MSPEALRFELTRLAANYRWTWAPRSRRLLESLPGHLPGRHPVQVVAALDDTALGGLAEDPGFIDELRAETAALDALLAESVEPRIAYCSPEFGLSALLPQYAGGLGVLAGDHLKSASDLGTPLAGVGLFYGEGVFRQVIEHDHQSEEYHGISPQDVGAIDTGVSVSVPFPGRDVVAGVWRMDVGRIPLLLLDTDREENSPEDRAITDRLYAGSRQHRLEQEMVLGAGGARALAAMGWDIRLHHLNEGHAGFIVFELIDRLHGEAELEESRDRVRSGITFTTHTPVPAGIDCFHIDLIQPYVQCWVDRWGCSFEEVWEMGADADDPSLFNMAALCLRNARSANGVSTLHGEVSRKLFAGVGIGDDIGHVTNGVHARTWTATHTQELFDAVLGEQWPQGDPAAWAKVTAIDDEAVLDTRASSSRVLADLVREKTGAAIDPDALIVGFARRFAPYKRASLILRQPERLRHLLADESRPVQFVFAGKAHPSDDDGKGLVAEMLEAGRSDWARGRIVFVPDYEMDIAFAMVQGADIWLNNPIRPREASGTSGEKAALNGGLNCSILDGWWAEMFDGRNGWDIPASPWADHTARDEEEAATMIDTIAAIAAEYHEARPVFLGRIRHAWATLGPKVTAARMLRDYEDEVYRPFLDR